MQRLDFNTGWHFSCLDGRDFDVTLPHDAMLNTPRNTEPGFTWFLLAGWRGNDYTYTKNLHITSELINKHLVLEFEGVYCMTTVTVNDRPVAEKAYGYTPFTVELDGLLREGDNTIEVTAHVPQDGHNRWYTGGGIYRPVHLLVGEDAYMQRYGVRVTTLSVAPACVRVEVMTHGGDCAEVRIAEKNGKEVVCAQAAVADGHAVVELEIPDAKLWNAEHPNEGYEGKRTFVDAYTDADSVEIFVNGKSAGKAQVKDYFAKIPCIYEPGELVGVGYDADGHEIYRTSVRTADAETVLTVKTDKNILRAGGQDFCFADVYVTDKNGTVKLLPDYDVKIEVVGAASLQGYGSAAYKNAEHYNQHHHKSWQGHLQAVLRSTEKTGPVAVTFTADGCAPAILHLSAE